MVLVDVVVDEVGVVGVEVVEGATVVEDVVVVDVLVVVLALTMAEPNE